MNLSQNRKTFRDSHVKLRRARRMFVYFAWKRKWITDGQSLDRVARIMQTGGLYAKSTANRDIRFHILRKLWRLEGGSYRGFDWHIWCHKKGWQVHSWTMVAKTEAA